MVRPAHSTIAPILAEIERTRGLALSTPSEIIESRSALVCRTASLDRVYCLKICADVDAYGWPVDFQSDAFFYTRLAEHGLPAPGVQCVDAIGGWAYLLFDWLDRDAPAQGDFALGVQLGNLLHRLHQIPVPGVGVVRRGVWDATDFGAFIADNLERFFRDRIREAAEMRELAGAAQHELDLFVARCRGARIEPRLLHGDVGLDNVIQRGSDVPVLIDPGWCIGGDPLLDVSYFLVLHDDPALGAGFRHGYAGFDALDAGRLRGWTIYHHVAKLLHRIERGRPDRIEAWKRRLAALLEAE